MQEDIEISIIFIARLGALMATIVDSLTAEHLTGTATVGNRSLLAVNIAEWKTAAEEIENLSELRPSSWSGRKPTKYRINSKAYLPKCLCQVLCCFLEEHRNIMNETGSKIFAYEYVSSTDDISDLWNNSGRSHTSVLRYLANKHCYVCLTQ